jgi:phage gp16-like protein
MRRRGVTSPIVQPARRGAPLLAQVQADASKMRAKVQIARKELDLDEETYRAVLLRVTGKGSSTDCGPSELDALLKEFRRLGWQPKRAGRAPSDRAHVRKIFAIWGDLAPHLEDGSTAALRAFVRRQTGRDAPEFLDAKQASKVVEGLKAWRARVLAKETAA